MNRGKRLCVQAYNTYGTEYDCMSIMNYRDEDFLTTEDDEGKTMVARNGTSCNLSKPNNFLRPRDVLIVNKMYCQSKLYRLSHNTVQTLSVLIHRLFMPLEGEYNILRWSPVGPHFQPVLHFIPQCIKDQDKD